MIKLRPVRMHFLVGVIGFMFVYIVTIHSSSDLPVVVILSFDGFRHDYLYRISLPNLQKIVDTGVLADATQSVFTTKTLVNHYTLATGAFADEHGVVDNWMYDTNRNRSLHPDSYDFYAWNSSIIPIWHLNEAEGESRVSACYMWAGSRFIHPPVYFEPFKTKETWAAKLKWAMEKLRHPERPANFLMMYFDQPDDTAHAFGPESPEVTSMVARIDEWLGLFVEALNSTGLWDKVHLIVTSDHGFTTVTQDRIIDLRTLVNTSHFTMYGNSPVLHILPSPGLDSEVYETLQNCSRYSHFQVLTPSQLLSRWHYRHPTRTLPITLVADEGYAFHDFYETMSLMNEKYNRTSSINNTYGLHGYDNLLPSMGAFFVARGPRLRSGIRVPVFPNTHVYSLLATLLGVDVLLAPNLKEILISEEYNTWFTSPIVMITVIVIMVAGCLILIGIRYWIKRNRKGAEFFISSYAHRRMHRDVVDLSCEMEPFLDDELASPL